MQKVPPVIHKVESCGCIICVAARQKTVESPSTVNQQLKECNSLLDSVAFALELYSPNHPLLSEVEKWQATASV